jgi:hypothetical protein
MKKRCLVIFILGLLGIQSFTTRTYSNTGTAYSAQAARVLPPIQVGARLQVPVGQTNKYLDPDGIEKDLDSLTQIKVTKAPASGSKSTFYEFENKEGDYMGKISLINLHTLDPIDGDPTELSELLEPIDAINAQSNPSPQSCPVAVQNFTGIDFSLDLVSDKAQEEIDKTLKNPKDFSAYVESCYKDYRDKGRRMELLRTHQSTFEQAADDFKLPYSLLACTALRESEFETLAVQRLKMENLLISILLRDWSTVKKN